MSRYSKSQRMAIAQYQLICGSNLPSLIKELILTRPSHLPLCLKQPDCEEQDAKTVAESFSTSCYQLMTQDTERNKCYQQWIDRIHTPESKWLEIGPGTDACLSLMLLENHPDTFYHGIEVNKEALKRAKQILTPFKNATLQQGFLDEKFQAEMLFPKQIDCILHEIFGVIASSEGVGRTMNRLKRMYPEAKFVPSLAESWIVPLELSSSDLVSDPLLNLHPNLFRSAINFQTFQLCDDSQHALLERLDFSKKDVDLKQTHVTQCKMNRYGTLSVLGIFIRIGCPETEIYTSSNKSWTGHSANWTNIGLVLPHPISIKRNQILEIISVVNLDLAAPTYSIQISTTGKKVLCVWDLRYSDLYGNYQELHTYHSLKTFSKRKH